jgi:hypothetical protein
MTYSAADVKISFGSLDLDPTGFVPLVEHYGPVAPRDLRQIHLDKKWGAQLRLNPPYVELVKCEDSQGRVVREEWVQIHIDQPKDL